MQETSKNKKNAIIVACVFGAIIIAVIIFVVLNGKNSDESDSSNVDFSVYTNEDEETSSTDSWPASEIFPDVPVFESNSYDVTDEGTKLTLTLSADDFFNLNSYMEKLTEAGATLQCSSDIFAAYVLGDVEIQIIKDKTTPMIILCGEEAVDISVETFADYPLPENGRMVSADMSESSENIMYITERCLSYEDALAYCEKLSSFSWQTESKLPKSGDTQSFLAQYTLDDKSITVDYYNEGFNCQIVFTANSASIGISDYNTDKIYYNESTGEYLQYNSDGTATPVDPSDYDADDIITIEGEESESEGPKG